MSSRRAHRVLAAEVGKTRPAPRAHAVSRAILALVLIAPLLGISGASTSEADAVGSEAWPSARQDHAMAYDAAREQVVLFGGRNQWGSLNDTWVWDGTGWTEKNPTERPPARFDHAMAYDAAREEVVLFGGEGDGVWNRTWVWDGTTWTQKSPAESPPWPGRQEHAMAYDAAREEVVLFGGRQSTTRLRDTWVWDGTTWAERSPWPAERPTGRYGHAMAYDAAREEVVLFGGWGRWGSVNDTWVWDGTSWMEKNPTERPSSTLRHAMAYDAARKEVLLFVRFFDGHWLGGTWMWDGTTWTEKSLTESPTGRNGHAMAYDAAREEIVLFGGRSPLPCIDPRMDDTWVWDGIGWVDKTPEAPSAPDPPPDELPDAGIGWVEGYFGPPGHASFGTYGTLFVNGDRYNASGSGWLSFDPETLESGTGSLDSAGFDARLYSADWGSQVGWVSVDCPATQEVTGTYEISPSVTSEVQEWDFEFHLEAEVCLEGSWEACDANDAWYSQPMAFGISVDEWGAWGSGTYTQTEGTETWEFVDAVPPSPTRSVTVTPPAQTGKTGESVSVTAHVTDAVGQPVEDAPVLFTRSGSNPGSTQVVTDESGKAVHTYAAADPGGDVVTAKAPGSPGAAGAAVVSWRDSPVSTEVVFDPPVVAEPRGEAVDTAFQALDEEGQPMAAATIRYAVSPAGSTPVFAGETTTDADGRGAVTVTPGVWPLQILAYADEVAEGTSGSHDPTEVPGAAVVVADTTSDPPDLEPNLPPETPTLVAPADSGVFDPQDVQELVVRATDPNGEPWTGEITVTNTDTEDTTILSTAPAASGQDATAVPAPPLEPGEHAWSAVARDARGLESPRSDTRAFTVLGNRPPSVPVLVAPDHDQRFSLDTPQDFTVTATDPDDDPYSATITVRDADSDATVTTFTTAVSPSGQDSTGAPVPPLEPGSYTWTATATDAQGAESEESEPRPFTVGNLPPTTPTLLSPKPAETLSTEGIQSLTVSATDPDDDPYTATITVRDAGTGSVVATFPTTVAPSGEDATGTPGESLPAGSYTWTATAEDVHGAKSEESEPRAFNVSVNRPPGVPSLVSPQNGEVFHVDDPQVFTIQAVDPEGSPYTGAVTVADVDSGATTVFETSVTASGAQSSGTPEVPLGPGRYEWRARATDAFGVTGPSSVSRSFTVEGGPGPPPAEPPPRSPTTRVSESTTGGGANGGFSAGTSISADGRYVAFSSSARNLLPGITVPAWWVYVDVGGSNGRQHIYVRDRTTGVIDGVTVKAQDVTLAPYFSSRVSGNDDSWSPSISADGRYVAFDSYASNLVSGDSNGEPDVFVHDRVTKQTSRVSVSSSGSQGDNWSMAPSISADGRYVAFTSGATNLVSGDTNGVADTFVHDRSTGATERASVSSSGAQGTPDGIWWGYMGPPSISANGRYVGFSSAMDNLVSGDTNDTPDVFVRDRGAGTTERVSVTSSGSQSDGASLTSSISDDGRYVAFDSRANNLAGTPTGWDQVYVRDRSAQVTERISFSSSGTPGNGESGPASISGDGRSVVYASGATNLFAGDRNGEDDVLLYDRATDATSLISHSPDGLQANDESGSSWPPSISNDGMHVAFDSYASNLVAGDTNGDPDVFAYNREMSLDCAGGSLSVVGCLSGYGFKATSNKIGLEDFYPYHPFDLGSDHRALLNAHNGNLVVQATDLEVPGQGLNLRLTRTYNSQWDQGPGPLGRGWRIGIADGEGDDLLGSVVSAALSADVGQLLEVVVTEDQFDFFDADGTRHHFVKGGLAGPGWHSPPGVNLTLSDHLVGSERRYRATRPDGVTYEFRPISGESYGLVSISDRKGNTLSFSYSSGALSSITDTTGRTLSFAWSGDYLSSVTFSGSGSTRTIDYTVDSSTGRLTSVSTAGRTVSYGYRGAGSSLGEGLGTVTDARSHTSTFVYDDAGALTELRGRADQTWDVAYNTTSCQPGSEDAVVATCVTDPEGGVDLYASSEEGNLLRYRDAGDLAQNSREYFWEGNRLVWESDEVGNTTEYAYNQNGQVILKRESGSDSTVTSVFAYRDVSPGVADLVHARIGAGSGDERAWRFGLAENGDLRSVTDPEGDITELSHYERSLLRSVTDPRGHTTTYGDTSVSDGGYHPTGGPPSVTDAAGHTQTFSYDFLGRLTSRVDRNGNTWSFGYDARGNLTSESVPGGGTTTNAYDAGDNLTSTTPPGGATVTNTYDARDQLTATQATIDGVLRKTTYGYDKAGRVVEVLEPRTFAGSPTVTQKVTYEYFRNARMRAMIDEEGNRTDLTYTPDGHLRSVQRPGGTIGRHTTTYTYNRRGQVILKHESGHADPTRHRYSPHGERLSTTTPKGSTTSFAYDKMGRLVETTNPDGTVSTRVYDPAGNLVRITQPVGDGGAITTSYAYTTRGEIASESDPSDGAHTITYAYDPGGRQTFRRDRSDGSIIRTVEQSFRADGALLERKATATGRPEHHSTFSYDAAGNPTAANAWLGGSPVSAVSVSYNDGFEPTSVSETLYPPSGTAVTKTVSYAYTPDGLLASRTADGKTTDYSYARNGRETSTVLWGGGSAASRTLSSTYLPNGAPETSTLPNGVTASHRYDPAERLTTRTVARPDDSEVSSWEAIAYDDDDHRTAETVAQRQVEAAAVPLKAGQATYAYDALGRLTSAKHPFDPKAATFELDDAGNVIRESGAGSEATYHYWMNRLGATWFSGGEQTPDGHQTAYSGRSVYSYDPLGDLTRAQTDMTTVAAVEQDDTLVGAGVSFSNITTTTYDAASHTKRVTESDGSYVDYAYDALSRLVRRIEHSASGPDTTTLFFHDGASQAVALETDAAGAVQARYLLNSAGRPLGQEDAGGRSYLVSDPRGNITQLLGQDQGVKAVFGYDPFGKDRPSHTATSEGWDSRLRFQTAPRDPKTGTYSLGPRMYDPSINRFAQADHYVGAAANMALAADPLTGNRYLYAGANPVGMIDDGHAPYSSDWHPTSWSLTGWYYSGWVSWYFDSIRSWNQYTGDFDVRYRGKWQLDLDVLMVRVRIDSTGQGACASCWDDFAGFVNKSLDDTFQRAMDHAQRIVQEEFAKFVKADSWKWDISLGDIFKGTCSNPFSQAGLYMTSYAGAPVGAGLGFLIGGPVGGLTGGRIGFYVQSGATAARAGCSLAS